MEEEITRIAKKLGENHKLMKKNLAKAEVFAITVDEVVEKTNNSTFYYAPDSSSHFIFGKPIECLSATPTVIQHKDRFYPITIPTIVYDLGQKLLEHSGITGIGRIPPNAKRMGKAMEAIDSGTILHKLSGLHVHDVCGLLKQWTKMLPSPVLPDFVSIYYLLIAEKFMVRKVTEMEAYAQFLFFGKYIPLRYKEVLAYVSYILWSIAQKSDLNGMTAKNLAICCPNLFIGSFAQRSVTAYQLESLIYLMEFFIANPPILLSDDKAAVLKENKEEVFRLTMTKPVIDPFFKFPLVSSNGRNMFPSVHNNSRFGSAHARGLPFKGLNSLATDIKNRIRDGLGIACLKPGEEDADENLNPKKRFLSPEMARCSPLTAPVLDNMDMPDNVYALITPPRDQFRVKRHSSTRGSVISRRSFDDMDFHESSGVDVGFGPFTLDFDRHTDEWCSPPRSHRSVSRTFSTDSFVTANEEAFEGDSCRALSSVSVHR